VSRPGTPASPHAALALRLTFLFHAIRLELLPPGLIGIVSQLAAQDSEAALYAELASLRAAFLESRTSLALDGMDWPETPECALRPIIRSALPTCLPDASPRSRAEALGRFCETLLHDRRASGSYFTPGWIADEIARTAVRGLVEGRKLSPDHVLSLRILDPAVGAGAFAIAAVEALAESIGEERRESAYRSAAARCIFCTDVSPLAADASRLAVWLCASRPGSPATIPADHITVADALSQPPSPRSFDAVIGNPPWGASIPQSSEDLALPSPSGGHSDSYILFLRLAAEAARDDGVVAMLVPDTILYQVRCEPMRRSLLERFRPLSISLLGDSIFPGATAPAAVLCLAGTQIAPVQYPSLDLRRAPRRALPEIISRPGAPVPSHAPLTAPHASFLHPPAWLKQLRDRLTATLPLLGDPALGVRFHDVGINYGNARAGRAILYSGQRDHPGDTPVTRGRDFGPFTEIGHSMWLRRDWRALVGSGDGVSVRDDLYRAAPKLLFRQTADRPVATIDPRGVHFGRSVIAVTAARERDLLALCVLMNSRAFAALYRAVAPEHGRVFAQVKVSKLKLLPVPPLGNEELAALAAALLGETDAESRGILVQQMDAAVYAAYGLDENEIAGIEQAAEPCLTAAVRARRCRRVATSSATRTR
jgi:hypothetical protein